MRITPALLLVSTVAHALPLQHEVEVELRKRMLNLGETVSAASHATQQDHSSVELTHIVSGQGGSSSSSHHHLSPPYHTAPSTPHHSPGHSPLPSVGQHPPTPVHSPSPSDYFSASEAFPPRVEGVFHDVHVHNDHLPRVNWPLRLDHSPAHGTPVRGVDQDLYAYQDPAQISPGPDGTRPQLVVVIGPDPHNPVAVGLPTPFAPVNGRLGLNPARARALAAARSRSSSLPDHQAGISHNACRCITAVCALTVVASCATAAAVMIKTMSHSARRSLPESESNGEVGMLRARSEEKDPRL